MRFRVWLANVCLVLAVAVTLIPFPVLADNPCRPVSLILEKIADDSRLVEIRVLEGPKLEKAARIFNNLTENDIPWPIAYLAIRDDGWALLMVGYEDQVCGSVTFNQDGSRLFLNEIDGVAA